MSIDNKTRQIIINLVDRLAVAIDRAHHADLYSHDSDGTECLADEVALKEAETLLEQSRELGREVPAVNTPFATAVLESVLEEEEEHYRDWCADRGIAPTDLFRGSTHRYAQAALGLEELKAINRPPLAVVKGGSK